MTFNEILAERVREGLKHVQRVREKRMFGSIAFMVHGKMCVSVGHNRLMCRIDPALHETAIRRKGARTVRMGKRAYKGFVYVGKPGLKSKRELGYWLDLSLSFNRRAPSYRKRI